MATLLPEGKQSFTNNAGAPLAGGKLYTYDAGTSTPRPTYQDAAGTIPNTNPVIMDARGEALIFWSGAYKAVLKDASDVTIWTVDNIASGDSGVVALTALLAGSTGSTLIGNTPVGGGTTVVTVADALGYQGNKISVLRYIPRSEWAAIFAGTSTYDCTAAVQACVNTGQGYAPLGTYLVDTINIPNSIVGAVSHSFSFTAEPDTVFQARTANTPVFQKVNTSGSVDNGTLGPFTVKAHASGSTTGAIKCTGFRGSTFDRIKGMSNGTAGFASLFDVAASPWLCYDCTWVKPFLGGQTGWGKLFNFNNNGAGSASNANVNMIITPWSVDNVGMSAVIDAANSAGTTILGGLIENNAGASAIKSGNTTIVQGVWLELNALDIVYTPGLSNDGTVQGCYFSNAHNVDFGNSCSGNLWLNNTEAGVQTFINNSYQNAKVKVVSSAGIVSPAVPVITYSSGQTGVLTTISSSITRPLNQMSGDVVMTFLSTWAAAVAGGQTKFTLAVPAGFVFKSATIGAIRGASGEPQIASFDSNSSFWIYNKYTDSQSMVLTVVYTVA